MTAEEVLRSNEQSAAENNQIVSSVVGKKNKGGALSLKKGFGATLFITLLLGVFLLIFSAGNLIPAAISERLIEQTDVQYADAIQTKAYVFQSALSKGTIPSNTISRLKNAGVLVGNGTSDNFTESANGTSLKVGDKIISASEFPDVVMHNANLYDAFNSATYGRAAYYYDDNAQLAFKQMGASRNNYKDNSKSFDEVMTDVVGEGNNINVGTYGQETIYVTADDIEGASDMTPRELAAAIAELKAYIKQKKCDEAEDGDDGAIICYRANNTSANDAGALVSAVGSSYNNQDTASILSTADTISKEQKSSSFYLGIMENISKMKAGYGNDSQINEAMNYLYKETESQVVDVSTGEIVTVKGSALESPSLYAVLSGEELSVEKVQNYSTERVMKIMNNGQPVGSSAITDSLTSTESNIRGTIGRMFKSGTADGSAMQAVVPTLDSSLVNNSFDTISGVNAGELLVEGAVNVGAALALQSGATAGDANAVVAYNKTVDEVLAMEAEVDRMHRSPLDVTSKNTFLGSLMYKFAVSSIKSGTFLNKIATVSKVAASSLSSLLPTTRADDEKTTYMTAFGECERMSLIGAVGTAECSRNETFDMSTVDISDPNYIAVKNQNVTCDGDGNCEIKKGSVFEKFVRYNAGRLSPLGVTDGGILKALRTKENNEESGYSNIPFISSVKDLLSVLLQKIRMFFGADDGDIATGKAFVNSSDNQGNWSQYKYAQRYMSEVRAIKNLRMYDGDQTAYSDIPYVGKNDPVLACLNEYYNELLAMETSE